MCQVNYYYRFLGLLPSYSFVFPSSNDTHGHHTWPIIIIISFLLGHNAGDEQQIPQHEWVVVSRTSTSSSSADNDVVLGDDGELLKNFPKGRKIMGKKVIK